MNVKKLFAGFVMSLMLLVSFQLVVFAQEKVEPLPELVLYGDEDAFGFEGLTFPDVEKGHSNYDSIYYLAGEGVVVGYDDGTYKPESTINRAEFLKILMMAVGAEEGGENCYPDVTNQWFAPFVCAATDLGVVSGYPDGKFHPEREINFAEASKIVANAFGLEMDADAYTDDWYHPFVVALEENFAIPPTIASFDQLVTRGEMAEMSWRIGTNNVTEVSNSYMEIKLGEVVGEEGDTLKTFSSCAALENYVSTASEVYYRGYYDDVDMVFDEAVSDSIAPTEGAMEKSAAPESELGGGAGEYSETNVQVEGVDEADIVKTDGEYIYYVKGDTVRVIKAYPPSAMTELSMVTFTNTSFYPHEIYVDGDVLTVIGTAYSYEDDVDGYYSYVDTTEVYFFDISDKANIELSRNLSFEGYYLSSRKVDDMLYLVANQYGYYWDYDDVVAIPEFTDSTTGVTEAVCDCKEVLYMPGSRNTDFMVIAGIDTTDDNAEVSTQVVLGTSQDIYSSRDNLYIAEAKYNWWWYDSDDTEEETIIHKFNLDSSGVDYMGNGKVPGTILNQFSMDESDGYFRIATTLGGWWSDDLGNNMYVLNDSLEIVGSLEGLAPGEQIYSVRFMGERAYMVTFETIDPLFVIDLSDPTNPNVLGELKIPGVSDYLHPYDANHLIGFGLDTLSESELEDLGWSWFQGIKISMFDVTDVNNPVELHKTVIGDRGTTSELLYNHKALLFDKDLGIMAFPVLVAEIPQSVKDDLDIDAWVYGDYTFQGAYVYDVSIEDGFDLRGTISHYDDDQLGSDFDYYYYYGEYKDVERIMYIGDYFYTISDVMALASEMIGLNEAGRVELE